MILHNIIALIETISPPYLYHSTSPQLAVQILTSQQFNATNNRPLSLTRDKRYNIDNDVMFTLDRNTIAHNNKLYCFDYYNQPNKYTNDKECYRAESEERTNTPVKLNAIVKVKIVYPIHDKQLEQQLIDLCNTHNIPFEPFIPKWKFS